MGLNTSVQSKILFNSAEACFKLRRRVSWRSVSAKKSWLRLERKLSKRSVKGSSINMLKIYSDTFLKEFSEMSRKWLGLGPPTFKNINLRPANNWNFNIYKKKKLMKIISRSFRTFVLNCSYIYL